MILDIIVDDKKKRLKEQKEYKGTFYSALAKPGLSVIGEFKNASPSHGVMNNQIDLEDRIDQYSQSADAISCLTEEDHFHGSVQYLMNIKKMTELPVIRKDFIIDPFQVYEAKAIGADAILLIAAILDDRLFKELYDLAYSLGLDVLCEVHDEAEMQRMIDLDVKIIGINNRNLKTFDVDLQTTIRLSDMLHSQKLGGDKLLVSESGVMTKDDIEVLAKAGIDAVLIGTVLMEAKEPEKLVMQFKETYERNAQKKDNQGKNILEKQEVNYQIKICGIQNMNDVKLIKESHVEYAGMVLFYPKSHRNVSINDARKFVEKLKESDIQCVAVTVSPNILELKMIEEAGFDYIQIHGKLNQQVLGCSKVKIIRAFNLKEQRNGIEDDNEKQEQDMRELISSDKVDYILIDAGEPGSGKTFSWQRVLDKIKMIPKEKLAIAGGLNSDNVKEAITMFHPRIVDISTGVENETHGGKDREKINQFIRTVRAVN